MKLSLIFALIFLPSISLASDSFKQSVTASIGMGNIGVTENPSTLSTAEGTEQTESGAAKPISLILLEANYNFHNTLKRSYFAKIITPLLSPDGSAYFKTGMGANFFFNSLSSIFEFSSGGNKIFLNPKLRYYWGAFLGGGYMVYNTELAKKSDVFLDISAHIGAIYNQNESYGYRAEASIGRDTGVATTSISMKLFIGGIFYL